MFPCSRFAARCPVVWLSFLRTLPEADYHSNRRYFFDFITDVCLTFPAHVQGKEVYLQQVILKTYIFLHLAPLQGSSSQGTLHTVFWLQHSTSHHWWLILTPATPKIPLCNTLTMVRNHLTLSLILRLLCLFLHWLMGHPHSFQVRCLWSNGRGSDSWEKKLKELLHFRLHFTKPEPSPSATEMWDAPLALLSRTALITVCIIFFSVCLLDTSATGRDQLCWTSCEGRAVWCLHGHGALASIARSAVTQILSHLKKQINK